MRKKNLKNCISVELSYRNKTELIYRKMPYPANYIWDAPEIPEETALLDSEETLYTFMGITLYNNFVKRINCKNFIIIETADRKEFIPENLNVIIEHHNNSLAESIESIFCNWLLHNELPEKFHFPIERENSLFEINFNY